MSFDDIKTFNGRKYSGMSVGGTHHWNYPDGVWDETKVAADEWKFKFTSIKRRTVPAPVGSGVPLKTAYHWYIIADQQVVKVDKDTYETVMEGTKFKIGHKRPYWRDFSYTYPGQMTYRQRLIQIFQDILQKLEEEELRMQMEGLDDAKQVLPVHATTSWSYEKILTYKVYSINYADRLAKESICR